MCRNFIDGCQCDDCLELEEFLYEQERAQIEGEYTMEELTPEEEELESDDMMEETETSEDEEE